MTTINSQLDDIHSMLTNGQRSVRVEPHTLLLWGLAGIFSILVYLLIINPESNFNVPWHGELIAGIFFAIVLLLVVYVDFRLTQRVRNHRDESLPFVHRQLRKVIYLIFGLIVLTKLNVLFFGGFFFESIFYSVLIGLGFFIYGLFSKQILCWIGMSLITLSIILFDYDYPINFAPYGFVSLFGIGFPTLAFILAKPELSNNNLMRLLTTCTWSILVVSFAALAYQLVRGDPSDIPQVSLQKYMNQAPTKDMRIVSFQKEFEVPIHVHLTGDVIKELDTTTNSPAITALSGKLLFENEKLDRLLPEDLRKWNQRSDRQISFNLQTSLTHEEGPSIDFTLFYSVHY